MIGLTGGESYGESGNFREIGEERRVYAEQVEVGVEMNAVRAFEDDIARRMRPVERRM